MYRKLLVLLDERESTQSAVRQAIELARVHRADIVFFYLLPPYVVTAFEPIPAIAVSPQEFQKASNSYAHTVLLAASELAEKAGVQSYRSMGSGNDDVKCICDVAINQHCDLIVVATEGDNAVMRILNGSIIPGLITASPVPVLICRKMAIQNSDRRRARASLLARQRRERLSIKRHGEDND